MLLLVCRLLLYKSYKTNKRFKFFISHYQQMKRNRCLSLTLWMFMKVFNYFYFLSPDERRITFARGFGGYNQNHNLRKAKWVTSSLSIDNKQNEIYQAMQLQIRFTNETKRKRKMSWVKKLEGSGFVWLLFEFGHNARETKAWNGQKMPFATCERKIDW